jgi:hypothetical protein
LKNSGRGKALEYRRIKKALEIAKNLLGNGFSVEQAAKLAGRVYIEKFVPYYYNYLNVQQGNSASPAFSHRKRQAASGNLDPGF